MDFSCISVVADSSCARAQSLPRAAGLVALRHVGS